MCATWRGVAITVTNTCSNSKSSIIVHLTGRQKHSSKFPSKSLITPFIKILNGQICAPYYIYIYIYIYIYCKWGKIRWAKLSHFSWFLRAPQKFSRESLRKLCIMALFKYCKRKAPRKFSREKLH